MSTDYEIVHYRPELEGSVAALQTALWSPDPGLNARYLEWKYERNPYTREPHIYLAFRNGEPVGMRGFYDSRWEVGQPTRVVPIVVADDLVVRSDERNRGLVTRIMSAAFADLAGGDCAYAFNLSGSALTLLGSLTMGWKSAGNFEPVGLASPSPLASLRARMQGARFVWRYSGSALLRSRPERHPFERLDRAEARLARSGVALEEQPRSHAMAELVGRLGHDGRIRHVRDATYLAWRFENPLHEYRFLYCGAARVEGYLVLKRSAVPGSFSPRVTIVDLEAEEPGVLARLLEAAVAEGRFAELVTWAATLPESTRTLLADLGFVPVDLEKTARGHPCALVRPLQAELLGGRWEIGGVPLLDRQSWDMRVLYSMAG